MSGRVVALSGGIGGAKVALGLSRVLDPDELLIVANTGDDFEHMGWPLCPDIDTLLYTLSGTVNPETGWGRADETWAYMDQLRRDHPQEAWFQLGDKDLETHRLRKAALAQGRTLSEATAELAGRLGVEHAVVPVSDDPVRTWVRASVDGSAQWLPFQEYFVRLRCEPRVIELEYRGSESATIQPGLRACLSGEGVRLVVICPSNPYLSIAPMLAVPGFQRLLKHCGAPIVAVSPIVGGQAIKGPTAKIMRELGKEPGIGAVADFYKNLIDVLLVDEADTDAAAELEVECIETGVTATVMRSLEDRVRLAHTVLEYAGPAGRPD